MLIFPAIDLLEGQAVRLLKGDYTQKTVYSDDPVQVAKDFKAQGATCIHIVDLEGAKDGTTPNLPIVCAIKEQTNLFCEIGGGIRSMDVIRRYMDAGIDRVILGTAAVADKELLQQAVAEYGEKIAVGVDIKDRKVAVKGWLVDSGLDAFDFCREMVAIGIKTLICTDISKDGAMQGTNRELYEQLANELSLDIIASGGVSSLDDVEALAAMGLSGAIIGKAYYTGAIDLAEAIRKAAL